MPLPSFYTTSKWVEDYIEYQRKYGPNSRESDMEFMRELKGVCKPDMKLLDIGCNTGNLLRLIQREFPASTLYGLDIVPEFILEARGSSIDIKYDIGNMCEYKTEEPVDVVTFNAALMCLSDGELITALMAARKNLVPLGTLLAFDYFHPYCQNIEVREFSGEDQVLHMRSYHLAKNLCLAAGFSDIEFTPFVIKQDLPYIEESRKTYTRVLDGEKASFRGVLYQPWCFLKARAS